ncbi:MAG: SufD family Fe-S cluster assembly protein [Candidatus Gottesmanbacteria bacterium]
MSEKHIIKLLSANDSSFVYTMTKKETLIVDIIITSSVSLHGDVRITMEAKGGSATVRCLVLPKQGAVITLSMYQTHKASSTKSNLSVKSLIVDTSTVIFKGNVYIGKHAKKSDAYQKNVNLLVGDGGVITTTPTLEILNNDVKCTHGVTTGTIPNDVLWYMKTRGISEDRAKSLYIDGFIHDSIFFIQDKRIENLIYNQLRQP